MMIIFSKVIEDGVARSHKEKYHNEDESLIRRMKPILGMTHTICGINSCITPITNDK